MTSNIFGGDNKAQTEFNDKVNVHSKALLNVVERLKDLESSLDLLNDKIELLDHNSVKNFKEIFHDIKVSRENISELKSSFVKVNEFNHKITKQIKLMTTKNEVSKLEKYIDLWNPMEFVSRDEVNQLQDKLRLKKGKESKLVTTNDLEKFSKKLKNEFKEEIKIIIEEFLKKK